ncbi:hypothetical protein V0288_10865 [Pannus brasiliensis CCIBt3594]|uniref:Uncharacterized protein n=1 Tax=Pannus brasiliensis CCIBt3594 TaxID=1427578 RepID=A0AAW9QQX9_9CHRO
MKFRVLFTIDVSHSYYTDSCQDFDFLIPFDSDRTLEGGRLIAKAREGKLSVFYAVDEENKPFASLAGTTLRVGLKLLAPFFSNFTDLAFASSRPLYRNSANPNALDEPIAITLVGERIRHSATESTRPVTLTLKDPDGVLLKTDTFSESEAVVSIAGKSTGLYSIGETYPGKTKTIHYYADAQLQREGVFGIVEISIDGSFYSVPPNFTLSFTAKEETLKYYVIAKNYSDADWNALSIADAGEPDRDPIVFDKIIPPFSNEDLRPDSLGKAGDRVVLFKSRVPVSRQQRARQKIRLQKNGEILIPNLPQPGADRANSDLIVQVSKPKL